MYPAISGRGIGTVISTKLEARYRDKLGSRVFWVGGTAWREDKGKEVRQYILQSIKEEWESVNISSGAKKRTRRRMDSRLKSGTRAILPINFRIIL